MTESWEKLARAIVKERYEDTTTIENIKHVLKRTKGSTPVPDSVRYSHMKDLSDKELVSAEWLHKLSISIT